MSIREQVRGELIDVVEWLEESTDVMVWRFARPGNEIKNGAQLVVRPGMAEWAPAAGVPEVAALL